MHNMPLAPGEHPGGVLTEGEAVGPGGAMQ
jgi:hypothetical protein